MTLPFNLNPVHLLTAVLLIIATWAINTMRRARRSRYSFLSGPPLTSKLGYLKDMHDPSNLEWHFKMANDYGHVARLGGGWFGVDGLYISDPLALNSVLIRDQHDFPESVELSGLMGIINHGNGLATVGGQEHKRQRKLISASLTASNVAKLVPMFYNVAHKLKKQLRSDLSGQSSDQRIDILDRVSRTALELISQGTLGLTFDSSDRDDKKFNELHEAVLTVLPLASKLFLIIPYMETWRKLKPVWLRRSLSNLASYLPWPALRKFKNAIDTMHPVCVSVYEEKKAAFTEGGIAGLKESSYGGKDIAAQIVQVNSGADEDDRMTDDTIIANISALVLGGQDTTTGSLSRLLSILGSDPSLQSRLRQEITQAQAQKSNGEDLDYNELNSLPLLDAMCRESLRLFPPALFVWRPTARDTVIPIHFPVRNVQTGSEIREIQVKKGTTVYVGLAAANRSTAIWGPDAQEFKPERWFGRSGDDGPTHGVKMPGIFGNSMTFLGGGRACPGMKFALLEMKLVIAVLLPAFSFSAPANEIVWKNGITVSPYATGRESEGPKAPMRIEPL